MPTLSPKTSHAANNNNTYSLYLIRYPRLCLRQVSKIKFAGPSISDHNQLMIAVAVPNIASTLQTAIKV